MPEPRGVYCLMTIRPCVVQSKNKEKLEYAVSAFMVTDLGGGKSRMVSNEKTRFFTDFLNAYICARKHGCELVKKQEVGHALIKVASLPGTKEPPLKLAVVVSDNTTWPAAKQFLL